MSCESNGVKHTLHGDDVSTLALNHLSDHIVDQTVFVPDTGSLKVLLVLAVVDLLENVLELAVVGLQDGVLGAHVQRQLLIKRKLHGGVCKAGDGLGGVVLCLSDTTASGEVEDLDGLGLTTLGSEDHLESALPLDNTVLGAILVTESVTTDNDRLLPAGYKTGNARNDNGRTENGSSTETPSQQQSSVHER